MNNEQLKECIINDIKKVFPKMDLDKRISFNRYSTKNQIRIYKKLFTYVFEFLGSRESEYEIFKSQSYIEILYKVAEVLIITESINETRGNTSNCLKEIERNYASKFGPEICQKFCIENNL